ncbi:MAG: hypothetical protein LBS14_00455 [Holosporaceae bacterium]|jgi:hypothetical protein|nr:hypothetical protein [Holosporaceae bacterium]
MHRQLIAALTLSSVLISNTDCMDIIPQRYGDAIEEGERKSARAKALLPRRGRLAMQAQISEITGAAALVIDDDDLLFTLAHGGPFRNHVFLVILRNIALARANEALGELLRIVLPEVVQIFVENCQGGMPENITARFPAESDGMFTRRDILHGQT